MFLDYRLKVEQQGSKVVSELTAPPVLHDDVRETIYRRVIETENAMTRKALIEMGWTPPSTEQTVHELHLALFFLAGLHPCLTIDGPPMEVAGRIFDAVMAERRELKDQIARQEENLETMRQHVARQRREST